MRSIRIYTYTDQNGHTFFSFYRIPNGQSYPIRVTIQNRIGTHILNFILSLRSLAKVDKEIKDE